MKQSTLAVLASAGLVAAVRQCTGTAYEEGGNWFCSSVNQIVYENFKSDGSYQEVSLMGSSGECNKADKGFNGPFGALSEDVRSPFLARLCLWPREIVADFV